MTDTREVALNERLGIQRCLFRDEALRGSFLIALLKSSHRPLKKRAYTKRSAQSTGDCQKIDRRLGTLRRVILVIAMVAVMAAMLAAPALATTNADKPDLTCKKGTQVKHNVTDKKAKKLEQRGFTCK